VTTDVFCLAETTADELRWAEEPWRRWRCLRGGEIGPRELARLGEVLGAGRFEDVLGGFSFLAGESQESPWVVAVPAALVDRLVELGSGEIARAADSWWQALGGQHEPSGQHLAVFLRDLLRFLSDGDGPFALVISFQKPQQEARSRR